MIPQYAFLRKDGFYCVETGGKSQINIKTNVMVMEELVVKVM